MGLLGGARPPTGPPPKARTIRVRLPSGAIVENPTIHTIDRLITGRAAHMLTARDIDVLLGVRLVLADQAETDRMEASLDAQPGPRQ